MGLLDVLADFVLDDAIRKMGNHMVWEDRTEREPDIPEHPPIWDGKRDLRPGHDEEYVCPSCGLCQSVSRRVCCKCGALRPTDEQLEEARLTGGIEALR